MTSTVDPVNLPQSTASNDTEIDREALARLLVEIARNVDPDNHAHFDVPAADHRMDTLRELLVGREISELSRVTHLLDEPEQLAAAVGDVLPRAAGRAPYAQLGEGLAPAVERAGELSIPESPRPVVQIPLGNDLIHAPTGAVLLQLRWLCLEGRHDPVDELEQPVFAWQ